MLGRSRRSGDSRRSRCCSRTAGPAPRRVWFSGSNAGAAGKTRIAPADQHVGVVASATWWSASTPAVDFGEVESARPARWRRAAAVTSASGPTVAAIAVDGERALQDRPAREPGGDDLAHGRGRGRVPPRTVGVLELAGAEMRAGRLVVHGRLHRWMNCPGGRDYLAVSPRIGPAHVIRMTLVRRICDRAAAARHGANRTFRSG